MKLEIYNAERYREPIKITVRPSGEMSISPEACKVLKLTKGLNIRIAKDTDGGNFYFILTPSQDETVFKPTSKNGYFLVNVARLLQDWGMAYERPNVYSFELQECTEEMRGAIGKQDRAYRMTMIETTDGVKRCWSPV